MSPLRCSNCTKQIGLALGGLANFTRTRRDFVRDLRQASMGLGPRTHPEPTFQFNLLPALQADPSSKNSSSLCSRCIHYHLSIRHALKLRRIPVALDGNLRGRAIQFLKIVRCQCDESRPDVLLQSVQFCSAWVGDDPRLLGKQPDKSDLSGGCMFPRRERLNNTYQTTISPLEPPGRIVGTCHGCRPARTSCSP